jgi:hypothetical protein
MPLDAKNDVTRGIRTFLGLKKDDLPHFAFSILFIMSFWIFIIWKVNHEFLETKQLETKPWELKTIANHYDLEGYPEP